MIATSGDVCYSRATTVHRDPQRWVMLELVTVYFVFGFIAFWGLLSLGQTIGGKIYLRRYRRLHGRPPRREDLSRWMWLLIIPVGMRSRGFTGPPMERYGLNGPDSDSPDDANEDGNAKPGDS